MEVKFPVPEKDFNSVVADMATRSVKVEIYQKGELAKTYYVGIQTVNRYGYLHADGKFQVTFYYAHSRL